MTETQIKILKAIARKPGKKTDVIETLQRDGIKRTTAYVTLDRLLKDGWLVERNEIIRVFGKVHFIL